MSSATNMRDLPAVDTLVGQVGLSRLPRPVVVDLARAALGLARSSIESGSAADPVAIAEDLVRVTVLSRMTKVVNATGVLLHTNLGRAPLSTAAVTAMTTAATSYTNLEIDLTSGERGGRGEYVNRLLRIVTGAEDALVVNNNAAALLLALAATSAGKAVPVARGELIEIGGSYRLPELMAVSGARLVEVGTTNRTRLADFVTAVQLHAIGSILKVHPSNYRVEGFTEEAAVSQLAGLAGGSGVPLIHDIGSGLLDGDASWLTEADRIWARGEPAVRQSLADGADLVTFSGDKLLGGPQAGLIVGSNAVVASLRSHPLARALRVDAVTDAALAATLESHAAGTIDDIPFWRMAHLSDQALRDRLDVISRRVGGDVVDGESLIGAGSVPGTGIPTPQLRLSGLDRIYPQLMAGTVPVVARRVAGDLVLDIRAVDPDDDEVLTEMVSGCL